MKIRRRKRSQDVSLEEEVDLDIHEADVTNFPSWSMFQPHRLCQALIDLQI